MNLMSQILSKVVSLFQTLSMSSVPELEEGLAPSNICLKGRRRMKFLTILQNRNFPFDSCRALPVSSTYLFISRGRKPEDTNTQFPS